MNKKLLVMSVCIALSLPTMAQRRASAKVKAPATWAESIAAAKNQAHAEMQKTCLPVASACPNELCPEQEKSYTNRIVFGICRSFTDVCRHLP